MSCDTCRQALQHPRFRSVTLEEANKILDEERAEEEEAIKRSGQKTLRMERAARAAWARCAGRQALSVSGLSFVH